MSKIEEVDCYGYGKGDYASSVNGAGSRDGHGSGYSYGATTCSIYHARSGCGSCYGDGDGDGAGSGYGSVDGLGDGDGVIDGAGSGDGHGYGNGSSSGHGFSECAGSGAGSGSGRCNVRAC